MKWSLPALAIKRPVTMTMALVTLVALGTITWTRLPVDFMVNIQAPALRVWIPYPGATPEQVEQEISIPAEGAFRTVRSLERITTRSDGGGSYIYLNFAWDADMTLASAEIRDRIERLKLIIPQEIERIFLRRFDMEAIPVMRFALLRDERQNELAQYARTNLRTRLMRVPGVADVTVRGRAQESVYVEFDQDALASRNLSAYQVMSALGVSSVNIGLGRLEGGEKTHFVRLQDEFTSVDKLAAAIVAPGGVRLREVARVNLHGPSGAEGFSINGKRGTFIEIIKEAEANAVATCDAVRAELDKIEDDPELRGSEVFMFEDQSEIIRLALDGLNMAGRYGSIMAILVLWMFLRRLRPTFVVATAIPCSLLAAPVYIYFTGRSFNLVTLGAMLISIGILVDNAIVVVENIHRHNALRPGDEHNAERGAAEVGMAITAATLTTLVVFVPILYMPAGELNTIMSEFAGPVTCALLASLVMALTIIPMAEAHIDANGRAMGLFRRLTAPSTVPEKTRRRWPSRLPHPHPVQWLQARYAETLRFVLQNRNMTIGAVVGLLLWTYLVPYDAVGFRGMPVMDMRRVNIRFRVDSNYGYTNATKTVDGLVDLVSAYRDELGIKNLYVNRGGWGGDIDAYLVQPGDLPPGEDLPFTTEEVRNCLHQLLPRRVPGGRVDCGVAEVIPDTGQWVSLRLQGKDRKELQKMAGQFMWRMNQMPGLTDVKSNEPQNKDEIQLHVDDARAAAAGISPLSVARTVDFALRGSALPYMKHDGQEIAVRGQLEWADRGNTGDLEAFSTQGPGGQLVSLAQLVDMVKGETPPSINRTNARSYLDLSGRVEDEDLVPVRNALQRMIRHFDPAPGYGVEVGENLAWIDTTLNEFRLTLIMSIILIYLLLAALFESWLMPLSVLTTVPLAYCGVFWALHLTETPLDTFALVGSVILCGIIVNNGIVIIDHVNRLRRQGLKRTEAVIQGGKDRLRPVMMTTLTSVLAIFPIALGGYAQGILDGLGRTLAGGAAAGTLLTLLVVPVVYTLVDDLQDWMRQFLGGVLRLGEGKKQSDVVP